MVAIVITGNGGGMAAPGCMHHGANPESRSDDPVRITLNNVRFYNFFSRDDNMLAGQTGVARYAQVSADEQWQRLD